MHGGMNHLGRWMDGWMDSKTVGVPVVWLTQYCANDGFLVGFGFCIYCMYVYLCVCTYIFISGSLIVLTNAFFKNVGNSNMFLFESGE